VGIELVQSTNAVAGLALALVPPLTAHVLTEVLLGECRPRPSLGPVCLSPGGFPRPSSHPAWGRADVLHGTQWQEVELEARQGSLLEASLPPSLPPSRPPRPAP
jgi:hypothetical protein